MIEVELISEVPERFTMRVRVSEGGSKTEHMTTLARHDLDRLGREGEEPTSFVERAFQFLLARESKESILRKFDLSVISTYFPEFEREIRR
jgi:hypothetical protein